MPPSNQIEHNLMLFNDLEKVLSIYIYVYAPIYDKMVVKFKYVIDLFGTDGYSSIIYKAYSIQLNAN